MANRWGNIRNSDRLYFLGLQNHSRCWLQPLNQKTLAPWKESYDQPRQNIEKQRHYFANKGLSSQGYGFPVVMYGCESWTIKKAERWRIDAFELWCWRRLLRVSWTARRSNQSILKEISSECSLEGLILKLKLQYFGHLMRRTDSFEKNPDAGKDWRWEENGTTEDEMVGWHHWLSGHEFEQAPEVGDGQGSLVSMGSQRVRHDWVTELNLGAKDNISSFNFKSYNFIAIKKPRCHLVQWFPKVCWQLTFHINAEKDSQSVSHSIMSNILWPHEW